MQKKYVSSLFDVRPLGNPGSATTLWPQHLKALRIYFLRIFHRIELTQL